MAKSVKAQRADFERENLACARIYREDPARKPATFGKNAAGQKGHRDMTIISAKPSNAQDCSVTAIAADAGLIAALVARDGRAGIAYLGQKGLSVPRVRAAIAHLRATGKDLYLCDGRVLPWRRMPLAYDPLNRGVQR